MDAPVKMNDSNSSHNIIKLNVGGQMFQTTPTTLKESEFLTRMLDGSLPTMKDENGAYFIDRDPKYFEIILSFMRTFKWDIPPTISKNKVLQEAEFYMLRTTHEVADLGEKESHPPSGLYSLNKDNYFFIHNGYCASDSVRLYSNQSKEAVVVSKNVATLKRSKICLGCFVNNNQNFIMTSYQSSVLTTKPLKTNWSRRPKTPMKEKIKMPHEKPSIIIQADPDLVTFYQKKQKLSECVYEVDPKTNFVCAKHSSNGLKIEAYFFGDRMVVDINGEWKYCRGDN